MAIALLILGFIFFQLLVILHEYGHFLVAKRNGVEVEEFGLGFPPKIYGKTMGKGIFRSHYTINLLPLGGFVKLKGENDAAEGSGTYGGASLFVKAKIILAGVFVNYLIAVVLFTFLALIGIPKLLPAEPATSENQFTIAGDTKIIESKAFTSFVAADSPAKLAGLELGDQIVSINSIPIDTNSKLVETTEFFAGQTVDVQLVRDGNPLTVNATFNSKEVVESTRQAYDLCKKENPDSKDCPAPKGYFGVRAADFILQRSTWSAPITGVTLSAQYTKVTLQGLGKAIGSLFRGDTATATESVSGPVGVFFVLKQGATYGFRFMLMIIAIISLTLAIMNVLPIPALDGGRLILTILFRKILHKPLEKETEEKIVGGSMVGLLALMVLITVVDVQRFIL